METATTPRYELRKDSQGYFVLDTATRQTAGFGSFVSASSALELVSSGEHAMDEFICRDAGARAAQFGESVPLSALRRAVQ